MSGILGKLAGGDRRSIGRVDEVVEQVAEDQSLFLALFEGMTHDDPLIRMRAADAVEKLTRDQPELLRPFRDQLLGRVAAVQQQEVRWHVAQMIPRLDLTPEDVCRAKDILVEYLDDQSRIVRTEAMTALAHLAEQDPDLRDLVMSLLTKLATAGSPAMRSRGRRLLKAMGPRDK